MIDAQQLLSKNEFKENQFIIDNFLLKKTSIILAAKEKVGKSTIALQLCKAIVYNENFLDINKEGFHVDAIIFFSNDSSEDSIAIKLKKMGFKKDFNIPFKFIFDKNLSIIDMSLKFKEVKSDNVLIIVDVLGGLHDDNFDINGYKQMTDIVDKIENVAGANFKNFGILLLHHLNKSNDVLGSRAILSRVSATLKLEVDEFEHRFGTIDVNANDYVPRMIHIKKDLKNHKWVLDKSQNSKEDSSDQYQLLMLNDALNKSSDGRISGNVNEIIAKTKMRLSPNNLTRWMKKNKKYLKQNNINFEIRKSGTTIVDIYLNKEN